MVHFFVFYECNMRCDFTTSRVQLAFLFVFASLVYTYMYDVLYSRTQYEDSAQVTRKDFILLQVTFIFIMELLLYSIDFHRYIVICIIRIETEPINNCVVINPM